MKITDKVFRTGVALLFVALLSVSVLARRDQANNLSPVQSLAPAARTSSANGTGVDLAGFEGATIVVNVGTYSDGTHGWDIAESVNNTTFTNVSSSDIVGSTLTVDATTEDDTAAWFGYLGTARYLRVHSVISGSPTTGCISGAVIIRGYPKDLPTIE